MGMNKLNLPISSLILAFVPWCYALLAVILPRPIVPVVAILSYLSLLVSVVMIIIVFKKYSGKINKLAVIASSLDVLFVSYIVLYICAS